jgi:osmotically inducible protein OsmC
MKTRYAEAKWNGSLKDGRGMMKTGSGKFEGDFSFGTRFQDTAGTNPEELIGAAHAGCYSMALAAGLEKAGFSPKQVKTSAKVQVEEKDGGFEISRVLLNAEADVPGIDQAEFKQQAEEAARQCVVSKALRGTAIQVEAKLIS